MPWSYYHSLLGCILLGILNLKAAPRPNILLLFVDDMGYSDLGCYGGEIDTPNLDKLAKQGIRYTQAYNTSKCWTSRISLLTGLYHHRSNRNFDNTALIGDILKPAGYRTFWAGKHHASFNPYHRGFDHFSGFLGGAINFWNPGNKARPGEEKPGWGASYTWAFDDKEVRPFIPDKSFYATDTFTDWALEWLDEKQDTEEPFFLYMAYNAPHWPLLAPAHVTSKYNSFYSVGYEAIRKARYQRQLEMGLFDEKVAALSPPDHKPWKSLSAEEQSREALRMQIHAAMVDIVDQNVGRLIVKLKALGELENTLIMFLVDNGSSHEKPSRGTQNTGAKWGTVGSFEAIGPGWANATNSPLRKWKVQGLEGGICTPLIAHWPKGIQQPENAICREPCHLIDFVPTFMELAGSHASYPASLPSPDGISLVPTFTGKPLNREDPLFFQYGSWQSIRQGDWKLVQRAREPWELYNIAKDRTETQNLALKYPERIQKMEALWEKWAADLNVSRAALKKSKTKKKQKNSTR